MSKLSRDDLFTLEKYSEVRPEFRAKVIAHKKNRVVHLGENATLYFEDRLTMQYQIQEMLRVEKIFDAHGINEELEAYNPLIPDGDNLKATFMVEYPEVEERKQMLSQLIGIEDKLYVEVPGCDKAYAIADEDLERETEEKTSSVHFVRFQLTPKMISALKEGADLSMGVDHPNYTFRIDALPAPIRSSLMADLN